MCEFDYKKLDEIFVGKLMKVSTSFNYELLISVIEITQKFSIINHT